LPTQDSASDFPERLELDYTRMTNYDKVYLDALREAFPRSYADAKVLAAQLPQRSSVKRWRNL
jgi:hypothetical protein